MDKLTNFIIGCMFIVLMLFGFFGGICFSTVCR